MKRTNKDLIKKVRFTSSEYSLVIEQAEKNKMNFSAYVRYMLSGKPKSNYELRMAIRELINEVNYIGHNINQIVRNHNSGLYLESDKKRLSEYMNSINDKVCGLAAKYGC